jgi:hypothetical protein
VLACCTAAALCASGVAAASQPLGDLDLSNVSLSVNGQGEALATYTAANGRVRHGLAWGAMNALPPSSDAPQVRFSLDYTGGQSHHHNPGYWQRFPASCKPYDGPALPDLVAACDAPDGTYRAIQSWQRQLPMRGFDPWLPRQGAYDFDLSHWSGPVAELDVSQNWTYGGNWTGIFGRLTYAGSPVFGFRPRHRPIAETASAATSTSTPTTPSTARADGTTPRSRCTSATEPSATASSRSSRRPGTRPRPRAAPATASSSG